MCLVRIGKNRPHLDAKPIAVTRVARLKIALILDRVLLHIFERDPPTLKVVAVQFLIRPVSMPYPSQSVCEVDGVVDSAVHPHINPVNAIYGLATVGAFHLHEMARNEDRDEILETLAETNRILTNPNWDTFVNLEQYARLKNGRGKVLAFHSILQPELLDGFEEVFMAAANFEDSAIFNIWGEQGVQFEPDPVFSRSLRYRHHPNGDLVKIFYVTEQQWSKKRREAKLGESDTTAEAALVRAANEVFSGSRFLWHGNKTVIDNPFGQTAQRLPNKPHGLNAFADIDNVVFLSSLNPSTDHFRFLESRGLRGAEVRAFTYYAAAYQSVMRSSIRNPDSLGVAVRSDAAAPRRPEADVADFDPRQQTRK